MAITRRILFESAALQIGWFEARPLSDACGEVERQNANVMVLPVGGVFAKHDAPGRHVVATPSHAVLVRADTPYRIGFPGAIGDRALTLRFDDGVAPDPAQARGNGDDMASYGLLTADGMTMRTMLKARLATGEADDFEIETSGLDLLSRSLEALRSDGSLLRHATLVRRRRAVERVKEAVAVAPADKWTVAKMAAIANLSPFHLCHVFRATVGIPVYDYVVRERLAQALERVLDGGDLTAIALDAGFASHSHFTARFRGFFGCSPAALRRATKADRVAELRKIMTARRSRLALN